MCQGFLQFGLIEDSQHTHPVSLLVVVLPGQLHHGGSVLDVVLLSTADGGLGGRAGGGSVGGSLNGGRCQACCREIRMWGGH